MAALVDCIKKLIARLDGQPARRVSGHHERWDERRQLAVRTDAELPNLTAGGRIGDVQKGAVLIDDDLDGVSERARHARRKCRQFTVLPDGKLLDLTTAVFD